MSRSHNVSFVFLFFMHDCFERYILRISKKIKNLNVFLYQAQASIEYPQRLYRMQCDPHLTFT